VGNRALSAKPLSPSPIAGKQRIPLNVDSLRAALEPLDGGRNIRGSADLESGDIEAQGPARGLNLAQLHDCVVHADIDHDRQPAQSGDQLAQEFKALADEIWHLIGQARDIAARPRQGRHQLVGDRVCYRGEHDRNE